jgi:hypothetical protein
MDQLKNIFKPHGFQVGQHIDLYHVYDNLSQTQFERGYGITCGDPDNYCMGAWHVITPTAVRKHLDWRNRQPTQFISLYDSLEHAKAEKERRLNKIRYGRQPNTVKIAHVRLDGNCRVWANSRDEILAMMNAVGYSGRTDVFTNLGSSEWLVLGFIPEELLVNRSSLCPGMPLTLASSV